MVLRSAEFDIARRTSRYEVINRTRVEVDRRRTSAILTFDAQLIASFPTLLLCSENSLIYSLPANVHLSFICALTPSDYVTIPIFLAELFLKLEMLGSHQHQSVPSSPYSVGCARHRAEIFYWLLSARSSPRSSSPSWQPISTRPPFNFLSHSATAR